MKSRFDLSCVLGSVFFITQLICIPISAEPTIASMDLMEIEERAIAIAEKINKTALAILSIPKQEHTFENTLKPWNQLSTELSEDLDALSDTKEASQAFDDLQSYFMEVAQDPQLHQILMNCCINVANNAELDSFQRYIGSHLVENNNIPVYFNGLLEEKNDIQTTDNFLNLTSDSSSEIQVSKLAHKILSANADAVCIHDIAADHHAYVLYDALKKNYAHFVYVPASSVFFLSNNHRNKGMLVASKLAEDKFGIYLVGSRRDNNHDRGGASCRTGIDATWGDGNGVQWEVYFGGEIHDNKGNYVEGEVIQRDDGSGQFDIHGGHESDHESRNE